MTGEEAFEIAAATAAISGLAALLILCLIAIIGVWRLFRLASDASAATMRASIGVEEIARRLTDQAAQPASNAAEDQLAELRRQAEALLEQQHQLQEATSNLVESGVAGSSDRVALDDLQAVVGRLDATVGEMAASLANLMQRLEQQGEGQ